MHPAISADSETGTTSFQDAAPAMSFLELLQADDVEVKSVVKTAAPMAEVSWTTADVMRRASDMAFAMEAHRRGMTLVSVQKILSGKYHNSLKKKHKRKTRKGKEHGNP
jgi:hypothetical protein